MSANACARCSGVGGWSPNSVCFVLRPVLGGPWRSVEASFCGDSALACDAGATAEGGADTGATAAGAADAGTTGAATTGAGSTGGGGGGAATAGGATAGRGMGAGGAGGGGATAGGEAGAGTALAAGSAGFGGGAGTAGASAWPVSQLGRKNSAKRSASSESGSPILSGRLFGLFAIPRSVRLAPGQRAAQFALASL